MFQVGNAVPPPMGRAIGLEIRKAFGVKMDPSAEKLKTASKVSDTIKDEPVSSKCEEEFEAAQGSSSSSAVRREIVA